MEDPTTPRRRGMAIALLGLVAVALLALSFAAGFYLQRPLRGETPAAGAKVPKADVASADVAKADAGKADDDEGPALTLDAAAQQRAGIRTATVPVRKVAATVLGVASVLDLQPMIELADNLAAARTQAAAARARLVAARATVERSHASFASAGSVSAAQVEAADAAMQSEQAAAEAADAHVEALVAHASRAWGPVLGPALVERRDAASRLLARRETLLQASVPLGDRLAEAPRTAQLVLDAKTRLPLRFVSWAPKADPRLPGASLLFATPARDVLATGASWPVELPSPREVSGGIVPASAVVWAQGRGWFFVRSGEKRFERHPLPADAAAAGGGGFVVPDVDDDDEVVVQGAQTLLSEEQRGQIQLDETGGR